MAATMADDIGREIRALRKESGMGLRELARQTEISPQYLCDIEYGRRMPPPELLEVIASALNTLPDRWLRLWVIDRIGVARWERLLSTYG